MKLLKALITMALVTSLAISAGAAANWLDSYDVVWNSPSVDARGSMPLGNGEVTINAWVEPNGDLQFLIGRSDSFSEIARVLKVGLIRVSLSPNPFQTGAPFSQHLHLRDGYIEIAGGTGAGRVDLKLFVDSDRPVVYVEGASASPVTATVTVESWRTEPRTIDDDSAWSTVGGPHPLVESADHFPEVAGGIAWYHQNESTEVPQNLALEGLAGDAAAVHDPLLHRTFGGYVEAAGFDRKDARTLVSRQPSTSFRIDIAFPCAQVSADGWLKEASTLASSGNSADAFKRTVGWWHAYWDRSWIDVGSAGPSAPIMGNQSNVDSSTITRGYMLQRYMQACDSRGAYPVKFNGGAFTVGRDGKIDDSDYRRWGDSQWYQNLRHMYHPMMASGDVDMTDPFFELYERTVPLAEARSRVYEGVGGVFFPETMTVWGTYAGKDYGWDRTNHPALGATTPWWSKTRNQGPELLSLMLDRWDYTQDRTFLKQRLLPMATGVLTYFDQRYARDANGRIVLDPTQSIETFWDNVVNDTPTIACLRDVCARLCALPESDVDDSQRTFFAHMMTICPEVPLTDAAVDGKTVRIIAPAEKHDAERHNCENPELYAVWPARLYGVDKPDLQMARDTYAVRVNHLDKGWGYDGNCAAVLGMADEAARILEVKCDNSNPDYRWPATWGPNFDWMPDQNHGGNLLETAQLMLIQGDGRKIILFPAWPRDWDVDFKLHAPYRTTVEATLRGGKIVRLEVTPKERAKDVVNALDKG